MNRDSYPERPVNGGVDKLNSGEIECLEFVAIGLGSKEIARRIDMSPHTVDARLKAACAKLSTKSRFHAAAILHDATRNTPNVTATNAHINLVYQDRSIPQTAAIADKGLSAGEGDGPDGLRTWQGPKRVADASRGRRSWLEPDHPIAKFFGGENRLPITKRLLAIFLIAIGSAIAVGILADALIGMSRLGTSP